MEKHLMGLWLSCFFIFSATDYIVISLCFSLESVLIRPQNTLEAVFSCFSKVFLSSYNVTFDLSCSLSPVLYNICISSSKGLVTEVWEIFCILYSVNVCRMYCSSFSSGLNFNYTVPWLAMFHAQWPWK